MKWIFLQLCLWTSTVAAFPDRGFALSEHLESGKDIALHFVANQPAEVNQVLHLPNGLALTYGNILSLGDFVGIFGKSIAAEKSPRARQLRFLEVFETLANRQEAVDEAIALNNVIANELQTIEKAISHGEAAEDAYQRISNEIGRQVNCITGGGCGAYGWWLKPGRYLKLAMENYDHFAPDVTQAYIAGHQVALQQAVKAHYTGRKTDLELAYAMDALACHYLSDNFAAGHLRTPRVQLNKYVSPVIVGSLLVNYMHNEENINGLHVHDANGNAWKLYGDFSYFNPDNQTNRLMLKHALQTSSDEIFNAYTLGFYEESLEIPSFIPVNDEYANLSNQDIVPLFYWNNKTKKLLRRKDIKNPYDNHWVSNWWGWSTLMALKKHYGMSKEMALLLKSET